MCDAHVETSLGEFRAARHLKQPGTLLPSLYQLTSSQILLHFDSSPPPAITITDSPPPPCLAAIKHGDGEDEDEDVPLDDPVNISPVRRSAHEASQNHPATATEQAPHRPSSSSPLEICVPLE
jgi:hypothetical protein